MKNISFDNPYLLLLAIPLILAVVIPYIIIKNADNKSAGWAVSLGIHAVIIALVILAVAGLGTTTVLTKTTVYVLADVSYSSDRNLEEIDDYIAQIQENLPENSKLGVVCFGKNSVVLTRPGKQLRSVTEAKVDNSATDLVSALNYTETLFKGDTLKRIVLITDGNDTVSRATGSIASTVERLTENGIKVDAIYLDNALSEGETEVQLLDSEFSKSTYVGHENNVKLVVQASSRMDVMVEIYSRVRAEGDQPAAEYKRLDQTVLTAEAGLNTLTMELPADKEGSYDYMVKLVSDEDISEYNNTRTFSQTVVGREKILLVTGNMADVAMLETIYGESAEIDPYVVGFGNDRVPFMLEELVVYDEIVLSNVDIRDIRNVNAFVDSLDMVVSQYGKSLIGLGDLRLQTNSDDPIFEKFQELLPVDYGNTNIDGRLYTIVLDVSHSMFMASKFTTAKNAAIKLLSLMDEEDYVCLVTFSGDIKVKTAQKVRECKQDLIAYIDGLSTDHGTDLGMGLEEALKAIRALNLSENQVMVISDGFSFDNEKIAVEVAADLYAQGATVSAIDTFVYSDGSGGQTQLQAVVNAGKGGKYYEIMRPEDVEGVVFGDMADDVSDVTIEQDVSVNIVKYREGIVNGMSTVPTVSGFITSLAKYDATVPLTVTYKKDNGHQETVPLYAYRSHGNGKVVCFTSDLTGNWTRHWTDEDRATFLSNMLVSNTPHERLDCPFTVNLEKSTYEAYIEVVPSILNPAATTTIKITYPNGRNIKRTLTFDSTKYFYTLATEEVGTYRIDVTYSYDDHEYTTDLTFDIPYMPEYDAFASFDKFHVYEFMRSYGTISVDAIPNLEHNEHEITTYKQSFSIPLFIAAVALFVADIFVRKLRAKRKKNARKVKKA